MAKKADLLAIHNEPVLPVQSACVGDLCEGLADDEDVWVLATDLELVELLVADVVGHVLHNEPDHGAVREMMVNIIRSTSELTVKNEFLSFTVSVEMQSLSIKTQT